MDLWSAHIHSVVHQDPQACFCKAAFETVTLTCITVRGYSIPHVGLLTLLNRTRILTAHFSGLSKFLWFTALPSSTSTTPQPQFSISHKLADSVLHL